MPSQSASVIQDVALVDQDQFPGKKVVDLETNSVGPGAVFLITNQPGRILSTAMIQLQETNSSNINLDQLVECTQFFAPTDANGNLTGTFQPFGRATNASLSGRAQGVGQLVLTAGVAVTPGNYDVAVFCRPISGGAPIKATQADLTAQVAGLSVP